MTAANLAGRLAGDAALRVLLKAGVQDGIRNLVAQLVCGTGNEQSLLGCAVTLRVTVRWFDGGGVAGFGIGWVGHGKVLWDGTGKVLWDGTGKVLWVGQRARCCRRPEG